jgi:hypothetical protein
MSGDPGAGESGEVKSTLLEACDDIMFLDKFFSGHKKKLNFLSWS